MSLGKTFVINKQTIDYAKRNQYRIKITSLNYGSFFEGYMTNEFKIRTDAKYAPMLNSDSLFESTQKAGSVIAGVGIANTGFWSQRYFQNGGYIILEPEIRIVDFSGSLPEDDPIAATNFFTSLCLPQGGPPLVNTAKLPNAIKAAGKALSDTFQEGQNQQAGTGIINTAKGALRGVVAVADAAIDIAKSTHLSDIVSINPSPVRVQIGNFFDSKEMRDHTKDGAFEMGFYVQAADCTFSKEMTTRGPLYVNIKLELQTMARPSSSGVGQFASDRFTIVTTGGPK